MKPSIAIIFVSIVLLVYSSVNYYIFIRGYHSIPEGKNYRIIYTSIFLILATSFVIGRFGMYFLPEKLSTIFIRVGSFWMAFMLYFFLLVLVFDIIKGVHHFTNFLPSVITDSMLKTKQILFIISVISIGLLVLGGHINALNPRIKKLNLNIEKNIEGRSNLQIALISDLHLGYVIDRKYLAKVVKKINNLDPDIVLLAGDMLDEDIKPVLSKNMGKEFLKLKAPLGVIGITGNHEYIGNAEKSCKYLEDCGVKILRDSSVLVDNSFYIIGREDRDKKRYSKTDRQNINALSEHLDKSKALIMLDHQPYDFDEKENAGIDLSLHGHTHHGQMWPLSFITKAIFKLSWGHLQQGKSHFYTSSGVGGWGPRVRIGNRPEIVFIELTFN